MKQYKIKCLFENGYLIQPQIELTKNDYNAIEFLFDFDLKDGRNVFELKKPNGNKYIKDIIDNKVMLVDYDADLNEISLIQQSGTYEFEIVHYDGDSKLTLQEHGYFQVRDEILEINDSEIEDDNRLPILDDLINQTIKAIGDTNASSANANEQAIYAKQQGDYAKQQAQTVNQANENAINIINAFESNVSEYTSSFNDNAEAKTENYDNNATAKLEDYNTNHTNKLKEYNDNHDSKIESFDTNATTKTEEYNTNHETKVKEYDENAVLKVEEYDTNHANKLAEYNINAETKVNDFNSNIENIKNSSEEAYDNQIIGSAEGEFLHLKDSANARIRVLEIDGNTKQITTEGKQLFDYQDVHTKTSGITIDDDGWITISCDNSAGEAIKFFNYYTNKSPLLKESTDYSIFLEVKNVSGTGSIVVCSGGEIGTVASQVSHSVWYTISDLVSGASYNTTFKTKDDFNDSVIMLRTFAQFTVGQKGSITFRISVLEDTSITTDEFIYEKYTGSQPSPSPDYPQEIEVLEGDIRQLVRGRNFLKSIADYTWSNNSSGTHEMIGDYIKINMPDEPSSTSGIYCSSGTTGMDDILNELIGKKVVFSFYAKADAERTIYSSFGGAILNSINLTTEWQRFSISVPILQFKRPSFYCGSSLSTVSFYIKDIQLEIGPNVTEFEEHQENYVDIDLQGNFIGKVGDASDVLRVENGRAILTKKIDRIILNGSEEWVIDNFVDGLSMRSFYTHVVASKAKPSVSPICTHFQDIGNNYANDFIGININYAGVIRLKVSAEIDTVDKFKTWLSENPVTIYYELAEPYEVDLGPVNMPKIYENISNINLIANMDSNIRMSYVKHTQTVINDLQNQIDNITELLSTPATSSMLLDNYASDLESEVI